MPVFSLPSKYGIGCFSKEAYKFVDKLKKAGQSYWQILPLGPTGYGDSPYQSFSTFAGNPYYIDLKTLTEFVSRVYHVEIPDELACRLPQVYLNRQSVRPLTETYIRLIVDNWDEQYIYGKTADESTEFIRVDYATPNFFGDWTYLKDFLTPHTQLNLVHPRKQENTYFPELIIYEPDFLYHYYLLSPLTIQNHNQTY